MPATERPGLWTMMLFLAELRAVIFIRHFLFCCANGLFWPLTIVRLINIASWFACAPLTHLDIITNLLCFWRQSEKPSKKLSFILLIPVLDLFFLMLLRVLYVSYYFTNSTCSYKPLELFFFNIRSRIILDIRFFILRFHLTVSDSHHLTLVDFSVIFYYIYIIS